MNLFGIIKLEYKVCSRCKQEKEIIYFSKNKSKKDGLQQECKECAKYYSKKNYLKDIEKKKSYGKEYHKKWYLKNKELKKEYSKEWRVTNKEYLKEWRLNNKEYRTEWRLSNQGLVTFYQSRRRALKRRATPSWSEEIKIKLLYKKAKEYNLHVDHIVPLQSDIVCGLHCWYNLQLLEASLNISKKNYTWPDMPERI